MRILGIDPGYATIGFGLIEGERAQYRMVTYGAITTPAGLPLSKRLYQIDRDMEELIGQLKPDVISVLQHEYHHRHRRGPWPWGAAVRRGAVRHPAV